MSSWPLVFATVAALIIERAPCVSNMGRYVSPILEMRPRWGKAPEELPWVSTRTRRRSDARSNTFSMLSQIILSRFSSITNVQLLLGGCKHVVPSALTTNIMTVAFLYISLDISFSDWRRHYAMLCYIITATSS